ncbi:ORF6 [Bearded dragon adenovirus 1]|uniref:ORF6 n=1 Tax=Bearded dragon adenovirus 1 TaxID=2729647 RepID=A0A6M4MJ18_9ADEN|nr:ORF6 [Bearded dragon adenovirus 1]QJR83114.1 ORF6 [Bearded dragon adenovirus 1]
MTSNCLSCVSKTYNFTAVVCVISKALSVEVNEIFGLRIFSYKTSNPPLPSPPECEPLEIKEVPEPRVSFELPPPYSKSAQSRLREAFENLSEKLKSPLEIWKKDYSVVTVLCLLGLLGGAVLSLSLCRASEVKTTCTEETRPPPDSCTPLECPAGFQYSLGRCFKNTKKNGTWQEAKETCFNLGSKVFEVNRVDDKSFLLYLAGNGSYWVDSRKHSWYTYFSTGGPDDEIVEPPKREEETRTSCPNGFDPVGEKCVFFQEEEGSWDKAKEKCKSMGAELFEPDNQADVDYMISKVCNRTDVSLAYTGLSQKGKKYVWDSGRQFKSGELFKTYQSALKDETHVCLYLSCHGKKDALAKETGGDMVSFCQANRTIVKESKCGVLVDGVYETKQKNDRKGILCAHYPQARLFKLPGGDQPNLYGISCAPGFDLLGEKCVSFQRDAKSWTEAKAKCQSMGAELFEPETQNDVQYMRMKACNGSGVVVLTGLTNKDGKYAWDSGRKFYSDALLLTSLNELHKNSTPAVFVHCNNQLATAIRQSGTEKNNFFCQKNNTIFKEDSGSRPTCMRFLGCPRGFYMFKGKCLGLVRRPENCSTAGSYPWYIDRHDEMDYVCQMWSKLEVGTGLRIVDGKPMWKGVEGGDKPFIEQWKLTGVEESGDNPEHAGRLQCGGKSGDHKITFEERKSGAEPQFSFCSHYLPNW